MNSVNTRHTVDFRCMHISEPDCGVKEALAKGEISQARYDSYLTIYEELKNQKKKW